METSITWNTRAGAGLENPSAAYRIVSRAEGIDENAWQQFVLEHPEGNFFQTPAFFHFAGSIKGYAPVVLAAERENGELDAVMVGIRQREGGGLKGYLSSRLVLWGAPLLRSSTDKGLAEKMIRTLLREYGSRCIYIEFRNLFNTNTVRSVFEKLGFAYEPYVNILVTTDSTQRMLKAMHSGKRRQIRKSLEAGAQILEAPALEQVKAFYHILEKLYKTKIHKPLPGWDFFKHFHENPALGRFLLIEWKGEIVGGIMCPVFKDQILYEWYIAGEDGRYPGVYPSILATWAALHYAGERGFHHFDFLGAGKADEDYGVRKFKASFGGEEVAYGRFRRINHPLLYRMGKWGLALLRVLRRSH